MKVLFIIPRYNLTNEANYHYYFPLGLGYISAVIKKTGHEVDCLNLNHLNGTTEELIKESLDKKHYDVICTGHLAIGYIIIEKIINAGRKHSSNPKIIVGGSLITSEPKLMFESLKPDFAVVGEGENSVIELLACLEKNADLSKVKGICYKNDKGETIFTKPRELIQNLDELPYPDFEGFDFNKKLDNMASTDALYNVFDFPRMYPILGSRGCPFQCTFCYHSIGSKYRQRSVDSIINEIKSAIKKYKINCFYLYDDLFAIDKERLYDFCKKIKQIIKETPWEFKWACAYWVGAMDKKLVQMLKDAGCCWISLGFESYSPTVLKSMKKPITPQQIDKAIKILKELKMPIIGNFIFGDVAETKETAKETLDYWKKSCDGQLGLFFINPYPNSEIYQHCIRKGIIKDKLDFIKNHISHSTWYNMTDNMTDEELLQLKKDILNARIKYCYYVVPSKINKTGKDIYEFEVKCPYCQELIKYKNCYIKNKFYYTILAPCRKCNMRFYTVSKLYKFSMVHYQKLDFFRKNYLFLRDNLLKSKV